MYKIAVLDDDEHWCLAVQRYLRKLFDVTVYTDIQTFLRSKERLDLVIVDFTILPTSEFETLMNGCELIQYLKTLDQPPLAILASGYINQNDLEDFQLKETLCAEADSFLAKDAGLEVVLQQVQHLLQTVSVATPDAESTDRL